MKTGDLVRFRAPWHANADPSADGLKWHLALLIDYQKWEKMATVLYNDKILRIPGRDVQKYGRRYLAE